MPTAANIYYFSHQEENETDTPLLLIHGAGGSHLYFPPELRRLNGFRIFSPDLPGHGKSKGVGAQSVKSYVQQIQDFMDAINLPAAIIVGHSMGSAIALQLALDAPDRVLALAILGGGSRLRVAPALLEQTANEATFSIAVEMITKAAFAPDTPETLTSTAAKRMEEIRPTVLHGDFLACNDFDISEHIAAINKPTLILCGTEDKMTPPKYAKSLHEAMPNSELTLIEGAGHMLMLEKPHKVAEEVERFIRGLAY